MASSSSCDLGSCVLSFSRLPCERALAFRLRPFVLFDFKIDLAFESFESIDWKIFFLFPSWTDLVLKDPALEALAFFGNGLSLG